MIANGGFVGALATAFIRSEIMLSGRVRPANGSMFDGTLSLELLDGLGSISGRGATTFPVDCGFTTSIFFPSGRSDSASVNFDKGTVVNCFGINNDGGGVTLGSRVSCPLAIEAPEPQKTIVVENIPIKYRFVPMLLTNELVKNLHICIAMAS